MIEPEFEKGDVLRAEDLQVMADVLAGAVECDGGGAGVGYGGGVAQVREHRGWPFEVFAAAGADGGPGLYVCPGRVLVGYGGAWHEDVRVAVESAAAAGEPMRGEDVEWMPIWCELDGVQAVEGFVVPQPGESVFVYLVLEGEVEMERLEDVDDLVVAGSGIEGLERWRIKNPRLRVVAGDVPGDVLRVWPLAVYTTGHDVPLNQLLWGDLSALECRGILDVEEHLVLPSDRSSAPGWGAEGHEEEMAQVAQVDFSTDEEGIYGELYACLDEDGALELYLGPWPDEELEDGPGGGDDDGGLPGGEDDDVIWEDIPGGVVPVTPPDDDDGSFVTRVRYGYVAGDGFESCKLVRAAETDELYWELVLDSTWLGTVACSGLEVATRVRFAADGVQEGTRAQVEMGLGACGVQGTGYVLTASAGLVFHGENAVDASKKSEVVAGRVTGTPMWEQRQRWFLSPKVLHEAGDFVLLEKARSGYEPGGFVKAAAWYRFSVDKELFRRRALGQFRKELKLVQVSGTDSATAADSVVTGVLSGSAVDMVWSMELKDL